VLGLLSIAPPPIPEQPGESSHRLGGVSESQFHQLPGWLENTDEYLYRIKVKSCLRATEERSFKNLYYDL